jgi:hypothetical protein
MSNYWAEIKDRDTAKKAAMQGVGAATLVSVVTAIMAVGGWMGAGPGALVDAALFGAVAFGIYRMSRAAAVCGLVLYLLERVYAMSQGSGGGGIMMAIFLTMAFVQSIRGTYAYHGLKAALPSVPNGLYRPANTLYKNPRDIIS